MVENNDAKDGGVSSWLQFLAASELSDPAHPRLSTTFAGWICESKPASQPSQPFEISDWSLVIWSLVTGHLSLFIIKPNRCFILFSACENGHMHPYGGAWNQGWCQPAVCTPHHLIAAPKRTGRMNIPFAGTAIRLQKKLCWSLVLDQMHYGKTTQLLTISIPITWQLTDLQKPYLLAGKSQQQNWLINGATCKLKYNQSLMYYLSLPDSKSQQN